MNAFADVECAICHKRVPDDMSLMVDTERGLIVVCYICDERRDEGIEEDDE